MRDIRSFVVLAFIFSSISGCAELRGIPVQLSKDQYTRLTATNLSVNIGIADDLAQTWKDSRNTTYEWSFWSNATLIPIALGGAGAALYKGSRDLITGFGLAAGTIAGTNSFIGASDIGAVYQSGIIGLNCVSSKLRPYVSGAPKSADATSLDAAAGDLDTKITAANEALRASNALDLTTAAANAERATNPTVVSILSNNEKVLAQSIADAQVAVAGAHNELYLYQSIASYARDRIIDIDNLVGMRIKPKSVSYSTLVSSLASPSGSPPKPTQPTGIAKSPTPPVAGAPLPGPVAAATPIADAARATQTAVDSLSSPTKKVNALTSAFDLSVQETNVASCIKASSGR